MRGCRMSKKIMIVDDEEDVRVSVGQILEISGYEVIKAEDGKDCLNKLEHVTPNLVLLDIMMPGISGWDVAATMKENPKWNNIPIVFLTAKGDEMSIGMGGLASEDYIVKPFDVIELKERVEKILKNS
jgi:DNA-binding response OmpR family regulator